MLVSFGIFNIKRARIIQHRAREESVGKLICKSVCVVHFLCVFKVLQIQTRVNIFTGKLCTSKS